VKDLEVTISSISVSVIGTVTDGSMSFDKTISSTATLGSAKLLIEETQIRVNIRVLIFISHSFFWRSLPFRL
jgi:hypothetical protein